RAAVRSIRHVPRASYGGKEERNSADLCSGSASIAETHACVGPDTRIPHIRSPSSSGGWEKYADSTSRAAASSERTHKRPFQNPSPGPSPKRGGEKDQFFSPPRFGEGPGEGFWNSL